MLRLLAQAFALCFAAQQLLLEVVHVILQFGVRLLKLFHAPTRGKLRIRDTSQVTLQLGVGLLKLCRTRERGKLRTREPSQVTLQLGVDLPQLRQRSGKLVGVLVKSPDARDAQRE